MQKHSTLPSGDFERWHNASRFESDASRTATASQTSLRRLDPLYAKLSQLCLVTPQFNDVYCINHRQAVVNLLQELSLIQKLYEGRALNIELGDETMQTGAMELNTHLINTAHFGDYSTPEKINILYQLRRAVERLYNQYFT